MTGIQDALIEQKVNIESQITQLQENLGGIKSKLIECQYPKNQICDIIKEYSHIRSSEITYDGLINIYVEYYSGDVSLLRIYDQVGYICVMAHCIIDIDTPVTHLRFKKV